MILGCDYNFEIDDIKRRQKNHYVSMYYENEPRQEKSCFSYMRTTKVQISLRIRAVWSAPLLFTA